jgi:hypothetical protein
MSGKARLYEVDIQSPLDNQQEFQSSKFVKKLTKDYNAKLSQNYNWFGIYAFYKGLFP